MKHGTAAIDHIGHIALAFVAFGGEQWVAKAADDLAGIVQIEQRSTDAVLAHGADAVGDDKPAGLGFDGRAAVADFDGLPHRGRAQDDLRVVPVVEIVGKHDEDIFIVLSRQHRIAAVNAAREQCHALVLHGAAIEREHAEVEKVLRLDELWQDGTAVVGVCPSLTKESKWR